ncbi:hypothetical protein T08_2626 [Trichinella sp. T8]|nr:hypothetical protein T08_2626 [Trichinella sp. T8]
MVNVKNFHIEQCISPVHIVSRHSKKFQCTKTGFQRSAMQITIAIKGALSYEQRRKEKAKTRVIRRASSHGRHETDRGRHEAEQEKTKGICGSPWVPILV